MTVVNTDTATEAGLLFSYYICLSFWAAQTLGMSMLTRNVGGETKKSVVRAMNFIAWAAGNAAGPQVSFRSSGYYTGSEADSVLLVIGLPGMGCAPVFHRVCHTYGLLCSAHSCHHHPPVALEEAE